MDVIHVSPPVYVLFASKVIILLEMAVDLAHKVVKHVLLHQELGILVQIALIITTLVSIHAPNVYHLAKPAPPQVPAVLVFKDFTCLEVLVLHVL